MSEQEDYQYILASIDRGLAQSAAGDVEYLGDFSRYAEVEEDCREVTEYLANGTLYTVGDIVCDCRYEHLIIVKIWDDGDAELSDGSNCSLIHCCHPVPHPNYTHE